MIALKVAGEVVEEQRGEGETWVYLSAFYTAEETIAEKITILNRANNIKKIPHLEKELKKALENLTDEQKEKIIIAYEPIWSIGTGIIPTNNQIKEMFQTIKQLLPNNKVLYGGSANEENVVLLKEIEEIDGYLLGGLSLKPEKLKVFIEKLKN